MVRVNLLFLNSVARQSLLDGCAAWKWRVLDLNVVIAAHHPVAPAGAEADASMVPGRFVPMHFRSRERNFPVAFVHWRERAKHRERVGLVMV